MAHSILPPSGAGAWVHCPQWVSMNNRYPQDETDSAIEGVAAHWVAAEYIAGQPPAIGSEIPGGFGPVTEEMREGAELYWEAVCQKSLGQVTLMIERPVNIPRIHPRCFGTPDLWAYDQQNFTLYLFDYKFGHRFVDVFENWQLIAYASGIIDELAEHLGCGPGLFDQQVKVVMTIVQPRCYGKGSPIRTWEVNGADLRPFVNQLHTAAYIALSEKDDAGAKVGEYCTYCPGRHACQALQLTAYAAADLIATTGAHHKLTTPAASLELLILERALDRLTARVEGLREQVTLDVKRGEIAPFHALQESGGKTVWNVPDETVITLGTLFGVDLSKPGVKTPNQAQKLGIDGDVISGHTVRQSGKVTLIPVNTSEARRVFG